MALLDQVEDYFHQLRVEQEDEDSSVFRLNERGYILVLEAGDNIRDLGNVGLNREDSVSPHVTYPIKISSSLMIRFTVSQVGRIFEAPNSCMTLLKKHNGEMEQGDAG